MADVLFSNVSDAIVFRNCHGLENEKAVMEMKERYSKRMIKGCFQEYINKIKSIRFFCAMLLVIALVCSVAKGMDELMIETKEWVTPWMAPHFFDNVYFVTFYGFIIAHYKFNCNIRSQILNILLI